MQRRREAGTGEGAPREEGGAEVKTSSPSAEPGMWSDLRETFQDLVDAWPGPPVGLKASVSLVAMLVIYFNLAPMRVDNGSADSCDPVRTYGEITERGMQMLTTVAGLTGNAAPRGGFVDIGSGNGRLVIWAATPSPEGAGFARSSGVELQLERHQEALKEAALAPSDAQDKIALVRGSILHHLGLLSNASVVYWNNLCFPSDVARTVAEEFSIRAPLGAVLVTLAELPHSSRAEEQTLPGLAVRRPDELLEMSWREASYRPFVYTRV
ncbi:unnamed protein product [Polarella glacialis]|uniref:DOT1 domain-containing protein n=1 Tax=Polarella glacialis TaxID=89957 RepID=A0A813IE58_POLGL|nr:unnamed protein product [Polarella glacialis]CAE8648993.1 unnamed protein product [Polarella glacialis]